MNRIDRLTAILIQLQSKPLVRAQEIADRFDISLRTVYRDIRALEEAGVPLIGEAGSGYSLMEGYRLPPVMFTPAEARAFLAAEKLIGKLTDSGMHSQYQSALFKVKAVLRHSEKTALNMLEEQILTRSFLPAADETSARDHLQPILGAISGKRLIRMTYHAISRHRAEVRRIEPVGIYLADTHWYLVAFCQLRNDYRNFRTDRITELAVLPEMIPRVHPPFKTLMKQFSRDREKKSAQEIVIRIEKDIYKHFGTQKYYMGYVSESETEQFIEMHFLCTSLEGFARWFMLFGDRAEIVRPDSLKKRISELLSETAARLKADLFHA